MTQRMIVAGRLTAAEDRTLRGTLLPFGRPGRTNMGRVVVHPGGVQVPDDVSALFAHLDHLDGRDDVATFRQVTETPEGLVAEWDVPETHGGDRLLAEFGAGTRTGISVELEPVTVRDGVATGTLIGCAFPVSPAFPDARLMAEDTPEDGPVVCRHEDGTEHEADTDEAGQPVPCEDLSVPAPETPDAAGDEDPSTEAPASDEHEENTMPQRATAPAGLLAGHTGAGSRTPAPTRQRLLASDASRHAVARLLASAQRSAAERSRLLAALQDIVPGDVLDRDQPQWVGEVWSGNAYQRRIVPLLGTGELTDLKVKGWRWVTKPTMERYAGSKAPVPSGPVTTEAYEDEAIRFAMAHDIDRKYRDFKDAAFFDAYFQAGSESYARQTDVYAVEVLKREATPTALGTVPAGVPAGWVAVLDAALDIIEVGTPSFALIEKSVYRDMFLTGTDKFLEFLNASIGFEEGTINDSNFKLLPVSSNAAGNTASATGLDTGEVVVGTKAAVKFRELGGGTPIRADALDLVNGGVDAGMFGYALASVEDARGLRIVDLTLDA